ncbi:MAG: hypothetical protein HBSAPP03_25180 [Phycisphaerae bacterium]|nr:MAG: hypothetical protein HBSAPP03_25180 [Phycisphaerae bacterium]
MTYRQASSVRLGCARSPWIARLILAAAMTAAGGLAAPSLAQPTLEAKAAEAERQKLVADFVHYVRIQRHDLAQAKGREILDLKLSDREFVAFVERTEDPARLEDAWQRAMRVPELQDVAARMTKAFEDGKLARARDPEEIARNIAALTGNARARLLARQRLVNAGEYAMPQLLKTYLTRDDPRRQEVQGVMVALGRQAVMPLSAALPALPPAHQEQVADVLGLLSWRSSIPALADVGQSASSDAVRTACARAIERLGGANASPAALYRELGEAYYAHKPETVSFPGESHQLLWSYEPSGGLVMTAIRTPVFHEAMAMRFAERSMKLESSGGSVDADTMALWVAANFSREIDTPEGYANPVYAATRRNADYYGVAAGADVAQRVLARALDNRDTPLARRTLSAVGQTAGASTIASSAGRVPLVEALTYPNRRVQYEAAIAIAASRPRASFSGAERVVPVLASTIRDATSQHAAVIAQDVESYQNARRVLQRLGYTVMPQARSFADLAAPIAEAPAVDLVVAIGLSAERFPALVAEVKGTSKTAATPVMGLTAPEVYVQLRNRYDANAGVMVRQVGIGDDAFATALTELAQTSTGGPISAGEARAYADRSLAVMRDLAVANDTVLNVADAALPLIGALSDTGGQTRLAIADILARIQQDRAQQAVVEAALTATGEDRTALLARAAGSARTFGNMLQPRHVTQLLSLAKSGNDADATAAAALLGSLGIANSDLLPLILEGR